MKLGTTAAFFFGAMFVAPLMVGSVTPASAAKNNCQVLGGPNKGKKGRFTEGGTWCEGSWGGTECGTDKCKKITTSATIDRTDISVIDGNTHSLAISRGYFETPDHGIVDCTILTATETGKATTTQPTAVCHPVVAEQLDDLKASDQEEDHRIADAVARALAAMYPQGKK